MLEGLGPPERTGEGVYANFSGLTAGGPISLKCIIYSLKGTVKSRGVMRVLK